MSQPYRTYYQYFYTQGRANKEPRITVCYQVVDPDDWCPEGWTAIGVAICSPNDAPNRKRGRAIAWERANYARISVPHFEGLPILSQVERDVLMRSDMHLHPGYKSYTQLGTDVQFARKTVEFLCPQRKFS